MSLSSKAGKTLPQVNTGWWEEPDSQVLGTEGPPLGMWPRPLVGKSRILVGEVTSSGLHSVCLSVCAVLLAIVLHVTQTLMGRSVLWTNSVPRATLRSNIVNSIYR